MITWTTASKVILVLVHACGVKVGGFSPAISIQGALSRSSITHGILNGFSTAASSTSATIKGSKVWAKTSSSSSEQDSARRAATAVNVLGTALERCCDGTGFYRDGCCTTGKEDVGRHTVCVQVTSKFLEFSKQVGNDLTTPAPQYLFPGLKDGDLWCLCAQRWVQAYENGVAPKLFLRATHEKTLTYVPFDVLREYAIDRDECDEKLDELNQLRSHLNSLL